MPRADNNYFVVQDVYTIMNEIVQQATARKDLAVVDASSFVSVGETVLRTGTENTLNAISSSLYVHTTRSYVRLCTQNSVGEVFYVRLRRFLWITKLHKIGTQTSLHNS